MIIPKSASQTARKFVRSAVVMSAMFLLARAGLAGTWTKVTLNAPSPVNMMLLLSDGTVMAAANDGNTIGNGWYRLTPNAQGSYVGGTWSTLAPSIDTRLYYGSQVLKDGRVFVAGGEYGSGGAKAEVYNPLTNSWTAVNPPVALMDPSQQSPVVSLSQQFFDSNSEILPDGSVLIMPVAPKTAGIPLIYNPATNTWVNGPKLFRGSYQDEATWVKLPDDSILTIDPFGTNSERYIPSTNTWVNDGVVPGALYDSFGFELGGALMLPNGKAFYLGSTGRTAIYTPSGTASPGTWALGATIPSSKGAPDAPCAMLVTGKILCAFSPKPTSSNHFPTPITFYEYDPTANTFTSVTGPTGSSEVGYSTYEAIMLNLPSGQILYSHFGSDVYVYTPTGSPVASGKPVISAVTSNGDGSYHLTGTGLNGISEGASYGDDAQMNSNYPIVRLTSGVNVYYCRTFNWSSTSVMTGSQVLSTEFTLPSGLPEDQYSLVTVANGIASDPVQFCTTALSTSDPASQAVSVGASVSLSVTATGTATVTYQWRRGITNLVDGGSISGATTSTVTINPVSLGDAGTDYNCVVTNGCGSVTSANATLDVSNTSGCKPNLVTDSGCLNSPDLLGFLTLYFTDYDGNGSGVPASAVLPFPYASGPIYAVPCSGDQLSAVPPVVLPEGLKADYDGDCQIASPDLLFFLNDYFNPVPACSSGCVLILEAAPSVKHGAPEASTSRASAAPAKAAKR